MIYRDWGEGVVVDSGGDIFMGGGEVGGVLAG